MQTGTELASELATLTAMCVTDVANDGKKKKKALLKQPDLKLEVVKWFAVANNI